MLVVCVRAYPKPDNQSLRSYANRTIISSDADSVDRFVWVYLLKAQARMVRIIPETGVSEEGLILDLPGKVS